MVDTRCIHIHLEVPFRTDIGSNDAMVEGDPAKHEHMTLFRTEILTEKCICRFCSMCGMMKSSALLRAMLSLSREAFEIKH